MKQRDRLIQQAQVVSTGGEGRIPIATFRVRLDNLQAQSYEVAVGDTYDSAHFLTSGRLLETMRNHIKMLVESKPFAGVTTIARFQINGLESAIARLKEACGRIEFIDR